MSADGEGDQSLFSDGSADCPLLNRPAIGADDQLVVACAVTKGGRARLNVMSHDGRLLRMLDEGKLGEPSITRDGKSVVYWKADEENVRAKGGALFMTRVDGTSKPTPITDRTNGVYADAACSPTADVVVSRRLNEKSEDEGLGLVSIDLTKNSGAEPDPLTSEGSDLGPSWSPDGSRILFRRELNLGSRVYRLNPETGDFTAILQNPGYAASPVWTSR